MRPDRFVPMDGDPRTAEQHVQWVYGAESAAESRDRYDDWAPRYEKDLLDNYGYRLPHTIAEHFTRWVTPPATVLDAGVGTGLVGVYLAERGFADLVGLDNSPSMLRQSARKGLYRALHEMTLGEPLGFDSGSFDAVISAGTFTKGHAPASGLRELARGHPFGGPSGGRYPTRHNPVAWVHRGHRSVGVRRRLGGRRSQRALCGDGEAGVRRAGSRPGASGFSDSH